MTRASPFALIASAFAAGLWLAAQFAPAVWLCAFAFALAFALLLFVRWNHSRAWLAALLMLIACGALRYQASRPTATTAPYNGHYVVLEGVVAEEPDVRPDYTYLRVQVQRLLLEQSNTTAAGVVLLRVDHAIHWHYGDVVRAWGTLDAPPLMAEFDYRDFLARQGVFSWLAYPSRVQRIGTGQGTPLYAALLEVKDALRHSTQQVMPAPESALLNGVLIGDDNELPEYVQTAFRRTGTSHIVAISGFNVSIVVALVVPLLSRWLNKRRAALVAIPAIVVYTLLTGASASVVRAALMAILVLAGQLFWRRGFTLNTLCAAAFIMCAYDPQTLFDLGFQLSFAATLGLVIYSGWLGDLLNARIERLPNERFQKLIGSLADVVVPTLAANLTTLPLILANFHQWSIIAPLTNTLVLPLQPMLMVLGILASIAGVLSISLGALLALPAYALLTLTLRLVEWTSLPAWATQPIYGFDALPASLYYLALGLFTLVISQPSNTRALLATFARKNLRGWTALLAGGILLTIGLVAWYQQPDGKLHVTFSGAGAFVQTPAGNQVIFAGGGGVLPVMGRAMPLWDKGVELAILPTRSDNARGDTLPLLQRYQVGTLIQPEGEDEPSAMLDEWSTQARAGRTQVLSVPMGTRAIIEPGVVLTIVQRENGCIGARLQYGTTSFELIGNTHALSGTLNSADVAFASPKLNDAEVLDAAHPRYVVWADTGGVPERLAQGIRTFILRDVQTVEFVSDGESVVAR
jgi:competence protein ComEC